MTHIDPLRLFQVSQRERFEVPAHVTEAEKDHLQDCEQCRRLLATFTREFDSDTPPSDQK